MAELSADYLKLQIEKVLSTAESRVKRVWTVGKLPHKMSLKECALCKEALE